MAVVAHYGLASEDPGILAIAFPGVRVLRGPHFPPFITDTRLIVFSDLEPFPFYPDREIIQISKGAEVQLDTRRGFLRFLARSGVKGTNAQLETLLEMEEEDFWREAKSALMLRCFPSAMKEQSGAEGGRDYHLYSVMFESFDEAYAEYRRLAARKPWMAILSSLLTMALKAQNVQRHGDLTPFYRQLLQKNQKFGKAFRQALETLLMQEGNRWRSEDEKYFLTFLLECATRARKMIEKGKL